MADVARPRPEEYQPALTWWRHGWRLLGALLISLAVWVSVVEKQNDLLFVSDVVLGIPAIVLVFFRRRWPLTVALTTTLFAMVSSVAAGPAALAAVSLATRRRWSQVVPIGVLSIATAFVFSELNPVDPEEPWWLTLLVNAIFLSAILAWGMYIGSRRELLWTLRARAERAEADKQMMANQSRLEERGRIAREMHDVLAHRISQISMRAGALSYREDLSAEELRQGVGVIREAAHQALTDLRGVLGVLRDGESGPLHTPQPTYADVEELVAEARRSGMRVVLHDALAPDHAVPESTGRTLYRIVQEGLTNARKHAPSAELCIEVSGSPEAGIDFALVNPLGFGPTATPGSGLGLIGVAERATLSGGHVRHGVERGEFVLRGWIPWTA